MSSILEGELSALAAKRVNDTDVREMQLALKHFEEAVVVNDTLVGLSATSNFYDAIVRCSCNIIIGDMI